jgi:hypothetical protein
MLRCVSVNFCRQGANISIQGGETCGKRTCLNGGTCLLGQRCSCPSGFRQRSVHAISCQTKNISYVTTVYLKFFQKYQKANNESLSM